MFNLFKPHQIRVPHWKHTVAKETEQLLLKKGTMVHLMLSQHIGAACEPVVTVGDHVYVGQIIAQSSAFVSAPIHASVSGVIEVVDDHKIIIKSDGKGTIDPTVEPPAINNDDDFVQAVKSSGLVGLGGAGFPTYIKFGVKDKSQIDTLIINAAECEPFITTDAREIIENTADVLEGILALGTHLDVTNMIIGIESHNKAAISSLQKEISSHSNYKNIKVKILPSKYPQGAEKVLIQSCLNRIVPLGKLPSDVGVVVSNVSSIGFLGRYLKTGVPLVTRRVTIDGGAVTTPKNILAPIGTLVKDLVDCCGGYQLPPAKILSGGPMMGMPLESDDLPITKRSNAVTIFNHVQAVEHEEIECIRCARCIDVCPVNLLPVAIDQNVRLKNMDELQQLDLNACIDCGLCSFSCPSNRTLVQNIRVGKGMLRELAQGGQA
ncbi:MAG: electron transport complex subunit RsxC [Defluviitaleaceae bacterium]|nr:electron transport complex subunit RsxC [Defluviitaleaceae bacterium]